jgi:peroxiredoxin/predicted DsbA family dithiol-disulfide isomerase
MTKNTRLSAGMTAPDFALHSTPDQLVHLSDFKGRPVILVFYPADGSPVCSDQLTLYNELLPEFEQLGAVLLGISVDGIASHVAFAKERGYTFPLLADCDPKGGVSKAYGVYRESDSFSERALFVMDADGTVAWSYVSAVGVNPGAEGILSALKALKKATTQETKQQEEITGQLTLPVSARDHILGRADAPVTLVEYGDYECPHCSSVHPIVKELLSRTGDSVRFVFRNFPLTQVHHYAQKAAEAAEVAADHDAFWPIHDLLFENQHSLDRESLMRYAVAAGLDAAQFASELASGQKADRVKEDFMSGVHSGVNGTPAFFINDHRYDGPVGLSDLLTAIEEAK